MRLKQWYVQNAKQVNFMLLVLLVCMHLSDLSLTFIGVNNLGFSEGNCYFKESVEAGDYRGIIIFKAVLTALIWYLVFSSTVLWWQVFMTILLIFINSVHLWVVGTWIVYIALELHYGIL